MTKQIDPYTLNTFGKASKAVIAMHELLEKPDTSMEQVRNQWSELQPLLMHHLLHMPEHMPEGTSLIHPQITGMSSAQDLELSGATAETWNQLCVLQGLTYQLQMWLLCSTHWLLSNPKSPHIVGGAVTKLISDIWPVLDGTGSTDHWELEEWMVAAIDQAEATCGRG